MGKLDPTTLANDTYRLRLSATDAGGSIASIENIIQAAGDLKIGNFTLAQISQAPKDGDTRAVLYLTSRHMTLKSEVFAIPPCDVGFPVTQARASSSPRVIVT